jgi:hypothetical protein
MVGGAAVVLVLGLAVYFLFLSGGGEEEFEPIPSAAGTATEETDDKGKKDEEKVPEEVDDDFRVGRDPFAPLAVEEVTVDETVTEDDGSTDTDTGTGADTDAGTGTGGTGNTPDPAPTASPTPTEDPEPEVTSYKVTLKSVDVAKSSAVIEVNGKRYQVKVKDLFTNSTTGPFKLTRVGELPSGKDTATVVFGDDAPVEIVQKETEVFKL